LSRSASSCGWSGNAAISHTRKRISRSTSPARRTSEPGRASRRSPQSGWSSAWQVADTTIGRRLKGLRRLGFVEYEVSGRRPHHKHVIRPTANLLRTAQVAQLYAGSRAGSRTALKPTHEAGLDVHGAVSDAASGAQVDKKRRDIPSLRDPVEGPTGAQGGEEIAATTNGRAELPAEVYEWMRAHDVLPSKLLCPECGQKCGTASGLASHIGHRHPDSPAASSRYREAGVA